MKTALPCSERCALYNRTHSLRELRLLRQFVCAEAAIWCGGAGTCAWCLHLEFPWLFTAYSRARSYCTVGASILLSAKWGGTSWRSDVRHSYLSLGCLLAHNGQTYRTVSSQIPRPPAAAENSTLWCADHTLASYMLTTRSLPGSRNRWRPWSLGRSANVWKSGLAMLRSGVIVISCYFMSRAELWRLPCEATLIVGISRTDFPSRWSSLTSWLERRY